MPDRGGSVLELHAGPTRAGAYVDAAFTHAAAMTLHRDATFNATYSGAAYAQALYVDRGGAHDLVIVATLANQVTAFDPTGARVWQTSVGTSQAKPYGAEATCGNLDPLGIAGTPVIDPTTGTLYLDAMVNDGGAAHHRLFALAVDTGAVRPGWPVDVATAMSGGAKPFVPAATNQRGGLTLIGGRVYVPYGGHFGDCGPYRGWVISVAADRPTDVTGFATASTQAGAWTPGGVSSDGTSVFAVFGNGQGGTTWAQSETVIKFGAGATFSGNARDYWAPTNWAQLDQSDTDLSGPAMPLDLPGATPSALLVSFGKDGNVYLLARDNLGGIGAPLVQLHASTTAILNTPTLYRTAQATYVAFRGHGVASCPGVTNGSNVVAVKITAGSGVPQMSLAWCAGNGGSGSPIATTTDGTADPIVWVAGAESDQRMHGYDGDTGAVVFAGGGAGDTMGTTSRFITPIVAKGRIFIAANGQLHAFTTH